MKKSILILLVTFFTLTASAQIQRIIGDSTALGVKPGAKINLQGVVNTPYPIKGVAATAINELTTRKQVSDSLVKKINVSDSSSVYRTFLNSLSRAQIQSVLNLKANIASPTFTGTVSGITSTMVGLSNVDNTSDVNKPISTATQTALNLKANLSLIGANSGIASLDGSGKVPLTQINDVLLGSVNYKGTYNASTNTPALPAATNKGFYYVVSSGGTQQSLTLNPGDWIISDGTNWGKIDNNNAVTAVNGQVGAVSLTTSNIAEGSNLYYTDTRVTNNAAVLANTAKVTNATHTGDVTGSTALTLATVNANVGTWNNVLVNGKGLVTAGSNVAYQAPLGFTPYNATNPAGYISFFTETDPIVKAISGIIKSNGTTISAAIAGIDYGRVDSIRLVNSGVIHAPIATYSLVGRTAVITQSLNSQIANTFLASPNGAVGTPTFRGIVATDVPTLNQSTTGNAATATNLTGIVAVANGGTGSSTGETLQSVTARGSTTNIGIKISGDGSFTGTSFPFKGLELNQAANGYRIGFDNKSSTKGLIRYNIVNGGSTDTWQHIFSTSNSASPDTFIDLMAIGASGNVGIGTSSPAFKLDVSGTGNFASKLSLPSGTTSLSSLRIPSGVAPTTPIDGDIWRLTGRTQLYDGTQTKDVIFDKANSVLSGFGVGAVVTDNLGNLSVAPSADRTTSNTLTKTASYTVVLSDVGANGTLFIRADATAGSMTITLPTASVMAGLTVILKKIDASANTVTISAPSIDGVTSKVISAANAGNSIISNGTIYNIIGSF